MEYMILIHGDETLVPGPGEEGAGEMLARFLAYNQILIDGGHWISGGSLQPTTASTTIRNRAGQAPEIIDGPFAETKEQLGGYYVISATDLDEALALAKQLPVWEGSIEVRPLRFRPDAA